MQLRFHSTTSKILLAVPLALLLGIGLTACTGSNSKGQKKGSDSEGGAEGDEGSDLHSTVDALLEKARSAAGKSAAEDIESAETLISQAADLQEKGKGDLATKKLLSAQKKLKAVVDEASKAADEAKKLAPLRTAAEDAKKKADAAKAQQNSPELYNSGTEELKKANELAAKGTTAAVSQAKGHYTKAKDSFDQAVSSAKENAVARTRSEGEKKAVAEIKEKAKAKGAEEKAAQDWLRAGQQEREGDSQMLAGDFLAASESFKAAAGIYQSAIDEVVRIETESTQSAELAAQQKKADEEALKNNAAPPGDTGAPAEATPAKKAGTPRVAAVAASGGITLPDGMDPAAFAQELDAEDEEFLSENYKKLTPSGLLEYDPGTGAVSIDYTEGTKVQKDAAVHVGKKEFLTFKPLDMPDGRNLSAEDKKKYAPYSFSGNTEGTIFFPVPLRFYARVEWYMQILTMDNNGTFGAYVMYDARKKLGYQSNWASIGTLGKTTTKGVPAKFLKSANEWFDKKKQVPMVFEYKMADLKNGTLTHIYNNDDSAPEGDERVTTTIPSTSSQRGLIGFWWKKTKFSAVELKITGILDKQAAVDTLRKKLSQPKAKPAAGAKAKGAEGAGDPKEKAGGTDSEPTTSGEEGTGAGDGKAAEPKKTAAPTKKAGGGKAAGGFDF